MLLDILNRFKFSFAWLAIYVLCWLSWFLLWRTGRICFNFSVWVKRFLFVMHFPDFYRRQQRHGYGIWNFLSSFNIFKTCLEGRRQNDPPEETSVYQRLDKMELRTPSIITRFFPVLSHCSKPVQYPVSMKSLMNSVIRTQLNSYQAFNFLQFD